MLHQQHRDLQAVADVADQRTQAVQFFVVQAASGLVEQQQLRLRGQGACQLHPLLRAKRQVAHHAVGLGLQAQKFDQLIGLGRRLRFHLRHTGQAKRIAQKTRMVLAVATHQHVLAHGHGFEQRQVLEGAADAQTGHAVARQLVERLAVPGDGAAVAHIQAREAIEQGAFARAVGANQGTNLAPMHIERHPVQGHDAAKADRNT